MDYTEGSRILAGRASLATIAAWAVITATGMMLLTELGQVTGLIDPFAMSEIFATLLLGIAGFYTVAFIVSVVLVAMWIHRAHANLRDAGFTGLEFTPGWAVGWFFVPFANLIKPFQAMRELWNASLGEPGGFAEPAPGQIKFWWGGGIVGNIGSNISTRLSSSDDASALWLSALLGAISSVALIASAWLLIGLIRQITAAQRSGIGAGEVFA